MELVSILSNIDLSETFFEVIIFKTIELTFDISYLYAMPRVWIRKRKFLYILFGAI